MIWALLKLIASGAAERLLGGLSKAGKWLFAAWYRAALAAACLFIAFQMMVTIPGLRRDLASTEKLLADTQLAHLETITNFLAASARAKREAEANVARVTAQQEAVTDETTRDLRSDLAAVAARFDRLRARDAARLAAGNARAADLPGTGSAPGRTAGAPRADNLRAPGELSACPAGFVCLTIDQAERASEDAHRHDRLIDWAIGQSLIRFAPESPRQ